MPAKRSIAALLSETAARLAGLPDGTPRLEAELLLAEATGRSRSHLFAWPERELNPAALQRLEALVQRRRLGEPLAYIRGHQEFWSLELRVTPDTLIPRPETELLVEAALARERPCWQVIALEQGTGAARVAASNLRRWAPRNAQVVRADWLAPVAIGSLDAVVSNPPYVGDDDPHLARGDLRYEPRGALAAGPDGLDAIRRLAAEAASRLRPGGLLALEHGNEQGEAARNILAATGYTRIETCRDLAGRERVTLARTLAVRGIRL